MTSVPAVALASLGRPVLAGLAALGRLTLYCAQTLSHILRPPFYRREFLTALLQVGWLSLPVVGLTAIFTGGALALQIYAGGQRFSAEAVVPQIVAIGMVRELGPVLVGLMIETPEAISNLDEAVSEADYANEAVDEAISTLQEQIDSVMEKLEEAVGNIETAEGNADNATQG